jgi:selenocysteine-specific elongation factor
VATGTLVSGRVHPGDELILLPGAPGGRRVTVRGVQVHARPRDAAVAGERVALNLSGVDVADVGRGRTLVTPSAFEATRVFDATLELLAAAKALKHGARVRFNHGTAEVLGRVSIVGVPPHGALLQVQPGERAFVRVRLEGPAVVARGDRYIVRSYSPPSTIGGGVVLDPVPPRTAIRTVSALERCHRLEALSGRAAESEVAVLALLLEEAGERGLPIASIASRAGIHAGQIESRVSRLAERGTAARVGPIVIAASALERLGSRVLALLGEHHRTQPLSDGLPREELRGKLMPRGEPAVFDRVVETLAGRGSVAGRDRLALTTHRAAPTTEESRAQSEIERALAAAGLTPPTVAELATMTGVAPALAERLIRLLIREKRATRVDALVFHADALDGLKEEIAVLKGTGLTKLDVATFKQRFKVTRKFAIPLLEYLDRERVTRRVGEGRTIL